MNLSRAHSTAADWEKFGAADPYYAVLTEEKYHAANLDDLRRDEFFISGQRHIEDVLHCIHAHLDPGFRLQRALDFGCGVGRLLLPLAGRCESVIGVDVSESMLREARRNCEQRGAGNVELLLGDDALLGIHEPLDLVHSVIVFQHIPRPRGEQLFRQLVRLLRPDGVGVIHIPYYCGRSPRQKVMNWAVTHLTPVRYFRNLVRGQRYNAPYMQMNEYQLNRLFFFLQEEGCHRSFVRHCNSSAFGVTLFFQKRALGDGAPY